MKGKFAILILLFIVFTVGDCQIAKYTEGDSVTVWVNRIGPFNNPQEYYKFHALPYCMTEINRQGHFEGLGESILGYDLRKLFEVGYKEQVISQPMCEISLDERAVNTFVYAINRQYWFQGFIDDLPVWGLVGEKVNNGVTDVYYLYTHLHFDIAYHNENIVEVNMTSENAMELKVGEKLPFSYSVLWVENSQLNVENRFDKYLDFQFFDHQIHRFALINSFMLVIFLLGLISLILLKTLKKEYSFSDDDAEEDPMEDAGWKLVHRDVFRSPNFLIFFAAIIGTGYQLFFTTFFTVFFGISVKLYSFRGSILSTFLTLYVLFSFVAGYTSGSYYIRNKGKNWIKTLLLTISLLPLLLLIISIAVNLTAKSYGALSHIPVATYVLLSILWVVSLVIGMVGTVFGRHWNNSASTVRVNPVPRMVPHKPWYLSGFFNQLISGVLPFASIFIELYFIYTSLWHYKYYFVFGYLFLSFIVLTLVCGAVGVVTTYFLLNNEDYHWQWRSLKTGASVSLYVFFYSVYYYNYRTHMHGFLQFVEFFGDVSMICLTLGVLTGTISFFTSNMFVNRIYRGLKSE